MPKKIIKGEVILESFPYAYVISASFRNKNCEFCLVELSIDGGFPCECGMSYFCAQCNNDLTDKIFDGLECKIFKSCGSHRFFIDDKVRLILRLLILEKKKDDKEKMKYEIVPTSPPHKRCFNDLLDHADDISKDSINLINDYYMQMEILLQNFIEMIPTKEKLISIYGKIMVNSFSFNSDNNVMSDPIGSVIYLGSCYFDHSCKPNATTVFNGKNLSVIALEDIDADDSLNNVFVSYISLLDDTETRRKELKTIWFFDCVCIRCTDIEDNFMKHSLKCTKCMGPVPVNIQTFEFYRPCLQCGNDAGNSNSQENLKMYKCLYKAYHKMDETTNFEDSIYPIFKEKLMVKMMTIFHPMDLLIVKTGHYLLKSHQSNEKWDKAKFYGELILPGIKQYMGFMSDGYAHLNHSLALITLKLNEFKQTRKYARVAFEIYKVTSQYSNSETTKQLLKL